MQNVRNVSGKNLLLKMQRSSNAKFVPHPSPPLSGAGDKEFKMFPMCPAKVLLETVLTNFPC